MMDSILDKIRLSAKQMEVYRLNEELTLRDLIPAKAAFINTTFKENAMLVLKTAQCLKENGFFKIPSGEWLHGQMRQRATFREYKFGFTYDDHAIGVNSPLESNIGLIFTDDGRDLLGDQKIFRHEEDGKVSFLQNAMEFSAIIPLKVRDADERLQMLRNVNATFDEFIKRFNPFVLWYMEKVEELIQHR